MWLKTRQEPSHGRIIYKGTHSHTVILQLLLNMVVVLKGSVGSLLNFEIFQAGFEPMTPGESQCIN